MAFQPQLLGMELHVLFFVRTDPPGYLRQRIPSAVAQRPVMAEREELGGEEHHQLPAEPERPAEPGEDGIGPVAGAGRGRVHRNSGRCYRSTASLPPSRNQEALGW